MNFKKSIINVFLTLMLIFSATKIFATSNSLVIAGYWTDWSPYWTIRPYPISGSLSSTTGKPIDNVDFDQQMNKLNTLNYAFLEANTNGVLQFFDPWSDLSVADISFCQKNQEICRGQIPNSGLGSFSAFSKLNSQFPNLKRIISVGGFNHDETFHNAFRNPQNFVKSVVAIIETYHIDGIDLDFEPQDGWTSENVANYLDLAKQLRAADLATF